MATLEPPYSDSGLDNDGDGLYDYLVLQIPVNVTVAGRFRVMATIVSWISQRINVTELDVGLQIVEARLIGWQIYKSGVDGPYSISLSLRDADTYAQLDSDTFVTVSYDHTDFDPPDAIIEGPVTETALDLNNDGLYDELWINFTANITASNTFQFWASLSKDGQPITSAMALHDELTPGKYALSSHLLGPFIRDTGLDGPYSVNLYVHARFEGSLWTVSTLDYTTVAYEAASFNRPWARFLPPLSDEVRDNDGDGLYDELVIHVPIQVDRRAEILVTGDFRSGNQIVQPTDNPARTLEPGNVTWDLSFEGMAIYASKRNGTLDVEVDLHVTGLDLVNRTTYRTASYDYTEFHRTSAEFGGADPEATLVDSDGDGRADLLLVDVPLEVRASGDYFLSSVLRTKPLSTLAYHLVRLDPGNRSITLTYSGITLNRSTSDGPWSVDLNLFRTDGGRYDRDTGSWNTPAYTTSQFEWRPVAIVTGSLKETPDGRPVHFGTVTVLDPTTKFLKVAYTDIGGQFLLEAYNGTFYVMAMGDYPLSQMERVSLQDGDNLEFLLEAPPPNALIHDISFNEWNESQVTTNITLAFGNQTFRAYADLYGDFDGFASDAELSILLANTLPPPLGPMPLEMEVDNRSLERVSQEYMGTKGEGELTSSLPLLMTYGALYGNSTEPEAGTHHNVTVRMSYDTEDLLTSARVALPPGFNGTPSTSASVTVRWVSPGTWEVDPGMAPEGAGPEELAEVRIETVPIREPQAFDPLLLVLWVAPPIAAAAVIIVVYLLWQGRRKPPGLPEEGQV